MSGAAGPMVMDAPNPTVPDEQELWLQEECLQDFVGTTSPGHFPVAFWADVERKPDGTRVIVCGGEWAENDGTLRVLPYSPMLATVLRQSAGLDHFRGKA